MSEWTEWAKQFEIGGRSNKDEARCLFAQREGPHKVACLKPATERSGDDYPACSRHAYAFIRDGWIGYIEGA